MTALVVVVMVEDPPPTEAVLKLASIVVSNDVVAITKTCTSFQKSRSGRDREDFRPILNSHFQSCDISGSY